MKLKIDFVSNSSSASFVVFDKTGKHEEMITNLHSLLPRVDLFAILHYEEQDTNFVLHRLKNLRTSKGFYFGNREDHIKRVQECADSIDNGGKCYRLWASDQSNDVIEVGLCYTGINQSMFESDDMVVIEGDGGY